MVTHRSLLQIILIVVSLHAYSGEKRALLVAVGDYPANSGWHKLSSANDATLMHTTLKLQEFEDRNIGTLINQKATKANILKSLDLLVAQSQTGDVAIFHFSGHGQQITDRNGDELDGYDEAFIPYDAQKVVSEQYKGQNHLLDDELNKYLYQLRKKVGASGDVIFILDACHSGTGTRSMSDDLIFRGTDQKFELENQGTRTFTGDKELFDELQSPTERGQTELSPFAVFMASGQQELNLEIKDQNNTRYGSLTFALGKVLGSQREKLSYAALFDLLRNEMWAQFGGKHQQTPQLEGATDRMLFAGQSVSIPAHCRVVQEVNSIKVLVDAGELNGLTVGSEISFYPVNTADLTKARLLAKGTVKRAGLTESDVIFETEIDMGKLKNTWGFVTKYQSGKADVNATRADLLRRVSASEPSLNVSFELVDPNTSKAIPFNHSFKIGDSCLLRISNNGSNDAFFQIIDIWPNNQIKLVFDATRHSLNDLYIKAGQFKLFSNPPIRMTEPTGVEMFKLVASEKQLDLSPIVTKLPAKNRGSLPTEFEQRISDLFEAENHRGVGSFSKINIFTRTFTIKEK